MQPLRRYVPHGVSRWAATLATGAVAGVGGLLAVGALGPLALAPAAAAQARQAKQRHFACSGPNSARTPCHFSTPSGNIRCVWTPKPNSVACELLSSRRAYRLRPNGKARTIKLELARRGQTLPTDQQLVFPQSLSCHDTRTTMTCNQDFGFGAFKLAPGGSHSS
jgi:hypothetical protein